MENQPLLGSRRSGRRSRSGSGFYCSRPSISRDENSDYSVYDYCGDNYLIPPDRRTPRSTTVDTQVSVEELPPRTFHRPLFIVLVTLVHIGLLIYVCVAGGVETIGVKPQITIKTVKKFGFIASANKADNSTCQEINITRYSGVNPFIGPNSSFLVQVGAKFGPCMKILEDIENKSMEINERDAHFQCCSFHEECAMMANASCPGVIIGGYMNCSSRSPNCTHGITLHPCCLGLHSECFVMSKDHCSFFGGRWHDDKLLCREVNCLDDICGMSGVKNKTGGHQWYRLFTPIFLHLGVIHLITNLMFQIPVGVLIEREIGTIQTCLIYLISGIGGNLICGLFNPLSPQVGASGALFGLIGLLIIKLLQLRRNVRRPCCEALFFIGVTLVSFFLGTLPYIGNFVHIGGFVFGVLASLALLPHMNFGYRNLTVTTFCRGIFLSILVILFTTVTVAFFMVKDSQFCGWCKYVDCVPYTANFCPGKDSDGYSDNDKMEK